MYCGGCVGGLGGFVGVVEGDVVYFVVEYVFDFVVVY